MRTLLTAFTEAPSVEAALIDFVRHLEDIYAESEDITLFIFALRTFFSWHRASELCDDAAAVDRIQVRWLAEKEEVFNAWLASAEDNPHPITWTKWTFQAKMTLLNEFVATGKGKA